MKTRVKFFMFCLVFAGFSLGMSAQNHLDALIKKCETLKSVDMEVVKNKRKTDKDVERKTVNIRITSDKKLVDEFLNAFKKDASDAEQAMFKKEKNGEINYYQCRFSGQTYTMVVREDGNANVTVGDHIRSYLGRFSTDSLRWNQQKEQWNRQKEQMKVQKDRMKQQMELQKEQMKIQKERVKQHLERNKYRLDGLDSILIKHHTIADSLILKSSAYINSINWDSITSKFGKDLDSVANKLGVGWDEIMEKYQFE